MIYLWFLVCWCPQKEGLIVFVHIMFSQVLKNLFKAVQNLRILCRTFHPFSWTSQVQGALELHMYVLYHFEEVIFAALALCLHWNHRSPPFCHSRNISPPPELWHHRSLDKFFCLFVFLFLLGKKKKKLKRKKFFPTLLAPGRSVFEQEFEEWGPLGMDRGICDIELYNH